MSVEKNDAVKNPVKSDKKKTVDAMLDELAQTVEKLDSEDISLEEAFKLYEKGIKLAQTCSKEIDIVEKKVIELSGSEEQS